MPIISKVGTRSLKVRLVYGIMFGLLILGAITMIYPMLLMISGSMKSETDVAYISPVPRYLWDDEILWRKYVESKYNNNIQHAEINLHRRVGSWRKIPSPQLTQPDLQLVEEFRAFRKERRWPRHWYGLGHSLASSIVSKNGRLFRRTVQKRFGGGEEGIKAYSDQIAHRYKTWTQVEVPAADFAQRRFGDPQLVNYEMYYAFKKNAPKEDWVPINLDSLFWRTYLVPEWVTVEVYNQAHGTDYTDYGQVLLTPEVPPSGQARADWEGFVRGMLGFSFIKLDPSLRGNFQGFLRRNYNSDIEELNTFWSEGVEDFKPFKDFSEIPLPAGVPRGARAQVDLSAFLRDPELCPVEAMTVRGPRQAFEEFVAKRRGVPVEQITPLPMPVFMADYVDCMEQTSSLRWEFATRNYKAVIDYPLLHGNGIRNTAIYCSLLIGVTLLVNPLAAYALSRYKPPSAYKVLLFCMVTMAFPPEVTMIPGFLLLKRFPLYSLIVGVGAAVLVMMLIKRTGRKWPEWLQGVLAVGVGATAGYWLTPLLCRLLLGQSHGNISLLNTFAALVLPRMANGYFIFLLKGFFDSLPRELYEAADIDGANEWTKFWMITMNLSKPILAVMALGAFTAAYSEFMMALVIIPDQKMWTIMVWLFQLQSTSHLTVRYASLVIAAVPTFLVFVLCQKVIMRGIVVPTEK